MNPQVLVLEELAHVTPFGVRFWDVAAISPAESGLNVVASPDGFPSLRFTSGVNRSGVYYFNNLPGMRSVENGSGDESFWSANPPSIPFTVEVSDPQGRYLPYRFPVLMPVHGLFGVLDSPLTPTLTPDATWLPAFSGPARELPGPGAAIRTVLEDAATGLPAAWALVTAQAPGSALAIGLADERGVVSLTMPYPEPRNSPFASPLGPGSLKLSDQTWPVTVSVFYIPRSSAVDMATLSEILHQGAATAWRDTARSTPARVFTLQFGRDLILRSLDSATGRELPVLLITPASPPL